MRKKIAILKAARYAIKLFFTPILVLFFTSCNLEELDSNTGIEEETVHPLLIKMIQESGTESDTLHFIYEGNRLIKEEYSDGNSLTYTYENNRLTGSKSTYGTDNTEDIIETYTYDDQNRVNSVTINIVDEDHIHTDNLTYSENNTVIEGRDADDDVLGIRSTLVDGNVVKIEEFGYSGSSPLITNYAYDTMHSPFKNIEFRAIFHTLYSENIFTEWFGVNNLLTETYSDDSYELCTFSYTYNNLDYPVSAVEECDSETVTYTFIYNTD